LLFALPAVKGRQPPGREALLGGRAGNSVAFSPDGKFVAAGTSDGLIVCNAATGEALATPARLRGSVWSVAFSPDGGRLAFVMGGRLGAPSGKPRVRLGVMDLATGGVLSLKGHGNFIRALAFSPDGKRLAAASNDATVRVWDVLPAPRDGEREKFTCLGHTGQVTCVAFSPDGKSLASAGTDRTVRVWNAATGKELLTLRGHVALVHSLTYTGDGKYLISVGNDRVMRVWDAPASTNPRPVAAHTGALALLRFSPDGSRLLTQTGLDTKVWDTSTYRQPA